MSFPCYERYKDSGVEWLGEIPEHWTAGRFSRVIMRIKDGTHGTFTRVDIGQPLLSAKNVKTGEIEVTEDESLISEEDHLSIISNGFPKRGDLLLTIVGTIGRACLYRFDEPLAFQRSVCFIRLCSWVSEECFYYATQSKFFQEQLQSRSKSSAQAGVYMGDVVATQMAYPTDKSEQLAISGFLDVETAKIDALIEEQRRLIELLKEKRQAVISHTVTKGLNSNVPMKDSGIEWLGMIPKHWNAGVLVRIASRVVVGIAEAATHAYADEGVPILRSTNIRAGKIVGGVLRVLPDFAGERESKLISAGDLITVRTGNAGVTAVIPSEFDGCQCFTMLITSLESASVAEFYCYYMNSDVATSYFGVEGWGTAQINISVPILKALPIPIPPTHEQKEIVAYLDREVARLDELSSEAESVVLLLAERRTALISAAVTGKIDVRSHTPKEVA